MKRTHKNKHIYLLVGKSIEKKEQIFKHDANSYPWIIHNNLIETNVNTQRERFQSEVTQAIERRAD